MGWEKRGGHEYYYTAKKRNGRVVKMYWPGEAGVLLAKHIEQTKQDQAEKQKSMEAIQNHLDRIDYSLDELAELTKAAVEAVALLNGFHFHKGEWRRKRGNDSRSTD